MNIDIKNMTTDELKNAVENITYWMHQKESFADMWGRNTINGMACISACIAYKQTLSKINNELCRNRNNLA